MGSIYAKIVVKEAFIRKGKLMKAEVLMTKVDYLRLYSAIARKESDESIQLFFDAFRL